MFHPWRELRDRPTLDLVWTDRLPAGVLGASRPGAILMHPNQLQVERRCTLTHELVHQSMGHDGCQPAAVEREVEQQAARLLIPIDGLVDAIRWAHSIDEAADELWVDVPMLKARLEGLSEAERALIEHAAALREGHYRDTPPNECGGFSPE